jgi:hypothetical protein
MSYKAIGLEIVAVLDDADTPDFVECFREVLLDYICTNLKGGLTEQFIRNLPVMHKLLISIESIPNETLE